MTLRTIALALICGFCLAANKATTAPAVDPLVEDACAAVDADQLPAFAATINEKLKETLADLSKVDLDEAVRLATFREFANYFGRVKEMSKEDRDTLKWLIAQKKLSATLMMAVGEADPPDKLLALLRKLRDSQHDQLAAYPDLTAAMCVVWEEPHSEGMGKTDLDRVARLYNYYINSRRNMRFDLGELPWQLAVYVVYNRISDEDILWATKRYNSRGPLGSTYFDVPYDLNAYYRGDPKEIATRAYTLPNLFQYGGVCVDQAYYATAVCRSLGVPATVAVGQGGSGGPGHAWVGYLQVSGRKVQWNFSEGRYTEQLYYMGTVTDPQAGDELTDADVSLLAELQNSSPRDRNASIALYKLRDRFPAEKLVDLFTKSINLSPGNRLAWRALADLGADRKLSVDQMAAVTAVLERFAAGQYPDFAYTIFRKMISGQGTAEQVTALDTARRIFRARLDLLARIRVDQGDLFRRDKRPREALVAYNDVLEHDLWAGPIVIDAINRVDELLHEGRDLGRLVATYRQVWDRMPKADVSAYATSTPFYTVGSHYADVLDETGDHIAANNVRQRLLSLLPTPVIR